MKLYYLHLKRFLTLILFFSSVSTTIFAQNGIISGKILDIKNEALIGATVKINEKIAISDVEGKYEISLKPGVYQVECSYVGYISTKKTISLSSNANLSQDFILEEGTTFLNTVTVTSGRYEKPIGEVTVSLEVLKPALIQSNNSQSIDKALEKVPGFNIIGGQANIRGGSGFTYGAGSRVLVLVDDIPALQADAGSPNWNDFQVETIEQIEILKGASSALYGSSALNGVVNIRTAYAGEKPITNIAGYFTSYRNPTDTNQIWWKGKTQPYTTGMTFAHRQKFGKLDLVAGGAFQATKSFNELTSDSLARVTLGTRYHINDRLVIGFNSNFNWGISRNFFYWKNGTDGIFQAAPTTLSETKKVRYTIDPYLSYYSKKGIKHKILGRFYSVDNQSGANQNFSQLYYSEYQAQKELAGFVATAGIVASGTFVKAKLYGDTTYKSRNLAPYFQLDKKWGKLNLSGGFRYEYNQVKTPVLVPLAKGVKIYDTIPGGLIKEGKPVFRIGMNYQLAKYTYFRSSFGQGYRFPTIAEKFITSNLGAAYLVPNTKLSSETGWSQEIGIKQGLKVGQWTGFLDVAAFWTAYQNMMEFTFQPKYFGFQAQNIGDTKISGIDMSLAGTGKIQNVSLSLLTGYTYINPKFAEFGAREKKDLSVDYNVLKYRNRHTIKFDAEAGYKDFTLAFSSNYLSNIEAIDEAFNTIIPGLKAYREVNNKGYNIMDVRASYTFFKYYRLSVLVKNLSNETYAIRPAIMEAPRNVSVRMDVKF
jgi:TonB-dependent SusC/RagA subfamily outer membrane receptor